MALSDWPETSSSGTVIQSESSIAAFFNGDDAMVIKIFCYK